MKCKQITDHLDKFLDGMLSEENEAIFQHHLRGCPDCQALRDRIRTIQDGYRIKIMEPFWSPIRVSD